MSNSKELHFLFKSELAARYCICLDTFNKWLKPYEDKIPLYVMKQRRFSPAQVKFLDDVFCYNPEATNGL